MWAPLNPPSSPGELCQLPQPCRGAMLQDTGANGRLLHRSWCPRIEGELLPPQPGRGAAVPAPCPCARAVLPRHCSQLDPLAKARDGRGRGGSCTRHGCSTAWPHKVLGTGLSPAEAITDIS